MGRRRKPRPPGRHPRSTLTRDRQIPELDELEHLIVRELPRRQGTRRALHGLLEAVRFRPWCVHTNISPQWCARARHLWTDGWLYIAGQYVIVPHKHPEPLMRIERVRGLDVLVPRYLILAEQNAGCAIV